MTQYPILNLLVRHGNLVAVVIGLLPVVFALGSNGAPVILAAAVAGSLVLGLFVRSYVELVRVVTDMLLPQ